MDYRNAGRQEDSEGSPDRFHPEGDKPISKLPHNRSIPMTCREALERQVRFLVLGDSLKDLQVDPEALERQVQSLVPGDLLEVLRANPDASLQDAVAEWVYRDEELLNRLWRIAEAPLGHHDPGDVSTVVADATLCVIRYIQKTAVRKSLRGLLVAAVRCGAISMVRTFKKRTESLRDDVASKPASEVDREKLLKAVERLKPELQEIILLIYFDGYTISETAERLDIPLGTAKSRLNRALKKLREAWPTAWDEFQH